MKEKLDWTFQREAGLFEADFGYFPFKKQSPRTLFSLSTPIKETKNYS